MESEYKQPNEQPRRPEEIKPAELGLELAKQERIELAKHEFKLELIKKRSYKCEQSWRTKK